MWKDDLYQFLDALEKIEGDEKIKKQKADQKVVKKLLEDKEKMAKKIKVKKVKEKADDKSPVEKKVKNKSIKPDAVPKIDNKLQELKQKPKHLLTFEEMLQLKDFEEKDKKPQRKPLVELDSEFILE